MTPNIATQEQYFDPSFCDRQYGCIGAEAFRVGEHQSFFGGPDLAAPSMRGVVCKLMMCQIQTDEPLLTPHPHDMWVCSVRVGRPSRGCTCISGSLAYRIWGIPPRTVISDLYARISPAPTLKHQRHVFPRSVAVRPPLNYC